MGCLHPIWDHEWGTGQNASFPMHFRKNFPTCIYFQQVFTSKSPVWFHLSFRFVEKYWKELINDPPATALNQVLQDLWDEERKRHTSYFHHPIQHVQSWTCNMMMATHLLSLLHLGVLHRSCSKDLASQQLQEDDLIDHPQSHQSAIRFDASWCFSLGIEGIKCRYLKYPSIQHTAAILPDGCGALSELGLLWTKK